MYNTDTVLLGTRLRHGWVKGKIFQDFFDTMGGVFFKFLFGMVDGVNHPPTMQKEFCTLISSEAPQGPKAQVGRKASFVKMRDGKFGCKIGWKTQQK